MFKIRFAVLALALLFGDRVIASPPFGGDDTGFVPPDKATAKCENGVAKKLGTLLGKYVKCVRNGAKTGLKGKTFDEETCEATAQMKFVAAVGKLTCPPCITSALTEDAPIHNIADIAVDDAVSVIYCGGTTPFGDDGGFVPPDKTTAKCEDGVAKAFGTLGRAILQCHVKAASAALANKSFDEEACEDAAEAKYHDAIAKLGGCPPCVGAATVGSKTRSDLDAENGQIYCASPGGAFLDAMR